MPDTTRRPFDVKGAAILAAGLAAGIVAARDRLLGCADLLDAPDPGRRRRPEPGWIDVAGRVVGRCWVAWGASGLLAS